MTDFGDQTWTASDGSVLKWSEMDNKTLLYSASLIERNAIPLLSDQIGNGWGLVFTMRGEAARDAVADELDRMQDTQVELAQTARNMRAYVKWRDTQ
jgi:hypothetical protein